MSKRNPIERSQYINNQYKEYLRSSFEFKTPKLQKLFEQQLEVEDLFKGPYVDLNLPFQRGMSLDEMIADGAVCKSFHRLGDMNFERPLYSHQAISEIAAERGMSEEDVAKTKYISNETFSSSEEVLKKAIESTTE